MSVHDLNGNPVEDFPEELPAEPLSVDQRLERLEIALGNHVRNNVVHFHEVWINKLTSVYNRVFGE
jgi:hypothetical protein